MAMKTEMFEQIVHFIREYRGLSVDCLENLFHDYPNLNKDTLASILSYEYQNRMKAIYVKSTQTRKKYWEYYTDCLKSNEGPGIIVRIAKRDGIAPCLIAKLILLEFSARYNKTESEDNISLAANKYLRNTALIPDAILSYEVFLCSNFDNLYSPSADVMRSSTGQQYEIQLHNEVIKLGLAFRDEEYLRRCGYDKTPDIKLEVPISIDGFIVNWIESKALFGSEKVHKDYTATQYLSYWNRFGPGLVIYWFGYVEKIVDQNNKSFLIRDHLPTDIVQIGSISK